VPDAAQVQDPLAAVFFELFVKSVLSILLQAGR